MSDPRESPLTAPADALRRAHDCLDRGAVNEGLAVLHELPRTPEVEQLILRFEREQDELRNRLVEQAEQARERQDWDRVERLIGEAQELDPQGADLRLDRLATEAMGAGTELRRATEVEEKRRKARNLLESGNKTLDGFDTAQRLLGEALALAPDDFGCQGLLDQLESERRRFLASRGQIATLAEAGNLEQALAEINDLIDRGWSEIDGERIEDAKARLEARSREFAEEKIGKYLGLADEALEGEPQLALRYLDKALSLPFIPESRREDLEDLRLRAEHAAAEYQELGRQVADAARLIAVDRRYEEAIGLLEAVLARHPGWSEAERSLTRARERLATEVMGQVRMALTRARTHLDCDRAEAARKEAEEGLARLGPLIDGERAAALATEGAELLATAESLAMRLTAAQRAVEEAEELLAVGELTAVEELFGGLDAEVAARPELRRLRARLARRQGVGAAVVEIRRALDDEDYVAARQQLRNLKRRTNSGEAGDDLYPEVESAYQLHIGRSALARNDFASARRLLRRAAAFDGPHAEEAAEELARLEHRQERERKSKQLYQQAQRHHRAGRLEEAWQVLSGMAGDMGSLAKEVERLRTVVVRDLRKNLVQEIEQRLAEGCAETAIEAVGKLAPLTRAEDGKLIAEVHRQTHTARARAAAIAGDWNRAQSEWLAARKYSPDDAEIAAGVTEAARRLTVREAVACDKPSRRIALLEGVYRSSQPDREVDERLAAELIAAGDAGRLALIGRSRVGAAEVAVHSWGEELVDIATEMAQSTEELEIGAYSEGLERLAVCRQAHEGWAHPLAAVERRRRHEVIDRLLAEAEDLDQRGAGLIHRLPIYRRILELEPAHGSARRHNEELTAAFDESVTDLIHRCLEVKERERSDEGELDGLIAELRSAQAVANEEQERKLKPQLDDLLARRRQVRALVNQLGRIRLLLAEARESGDFGVVRRLLAEASRRFSAHDPRLMKLEKEVYESEEHRRRAAQLIEEVVQSLAEEEFAELARAASELRRLDPEDELGLRRGITLSSPGMGDRPAWSELAGWADARQRYLERLTAWLAERRPDLGSMERREAELWAGHDPLDEGCAQGLADLAAREYRPALARLAEVPEGPSSRRAEPILTEIASLKAELEKRLVRLEAEVARVRRDRARVGQLIDEAGQAIQARDPERARKLVDEGLALAPGHRILQHFREVISRGR